MALHKMLCQINQDIHHGDKVNSFAMLQIKQFEYLKKKKKKKPCIGASTERFEYATTNVE